MQTLGASYNNDERKSFMDVWRYSGYLMGIPETILFRDEAEALHMFDIGNMCEPEAPIESIVMANALVNSAPLLAGRTSGEERQKLAHYVYRISRGLIGRHVAKQLM